MSAARATLIGNVGDDPTIKYTASGIAQSSFSIAVNRNVKKGNEWESETDWYNCVAWGATAERICDLLYKGAKVFVDGDMQIRKWSDNNNQKHQRLEVTVRSYDLLSPKRQTAKDTEGYTKEAEDIPWE